MMLFIFNKDRIIMIKTRPVKQWAKNNNNKKKMIKTRCVVVKEAWTVWAHGRLNFYLCCKNVVVEKQHRIVTMSKKY